MKSNEENNIPLSALQHWIFCRRQAALIHLEGAWAENRLTAEGRVLHRRVHDDPSESRGNARIARGLPLRSLRLGLYGVADVVEFHPPEGGVVGEWKEAVRLAVEAALDGCGPAGALSASLKGWRIIPVETKRGGPKRNDCDRVQVCAQAMCLEEMLGVGIPEGAIFYGKIRRREKVDFTPELRGKVAAAAAGLVCIFGGDATPPPEPGPKCRSCSLRSQCMPDASPQASRWLEKAVRQALESRDAKEDAA